MLVSPILFLLSFFSKYRLSIPSRFFLYKNPRFKKSGVWFHVCSFGEVRSLSPLISKISDDINISVITKTGYDEAKKFDVDVRFLPYEFWLFFWINRQKILIVSEAEYWYMLFFMAKRRGVKSILINARISDNSYRSYLRFKWFYKKIFENIDEVFAQSDKDKKRLIELGAKNVKVTGNIKAYSKIEPTKEYKKDSKTTITLASTHEGEEELILKYLPFKKDMKIIVVPRHPERFDAVFNLLKEYAKKMDLSISRFSNSQNFDSDITLVDMMGELINIYAISDIVLLGGSFVKGVGGHNPLECARFNTKIISGKYFFNQKPLYDLVENIDIIDIKELPDALFRVKKSRADFRVDMKPIFEAIESVV